jgi:hypothetical protein
MGYPVFARFTNQFFDTYLTGNLTQAHDMVKQATPIHGKFRYKLDFWNACLTATLGDPGKAIQILSDAFQSGIWWSSQILEKEPDFEILRNDAKFKSLILQAKKFESIEPEEASPVTHQVKYNSTNQYIINLHPRNGNIEFYRSFFEEYCASTKVNMILIQSSQRNGSHEFHWDDHEKAFIDIKQSIKENALQPIEFWGASQGSVIAYVMAMEFDVSMRALMPALSERFIQFPKSHHYSGSIQIFAGLRDQYYQSNLAFHNRLLSHGLNSHFIELNGVGHHIPENITELLLNSEKGTI